jgi:hypothetical protein
MKPLFIPLMRWAFAAFSDGSKTTEFRPGGPGSPWNERTCPPGRPVILSLGYGRAFRRWAEVERFELLEAPPDPRAWALCYGDRPGPVAAIHLRVPGPKGSLEELSRLCAFPADPASPILGSIETYAHVLLADGRSLDVTGDLLVSLDLTTVPEDEESLPGADEFRRAFDSAQRPRIRTAHDAAGNPYFTRF